MKCKQCDAVLDAGDKFCGHCGAPVASITVLGTNTQQESGIDRASIGKSSNISTKKLIAVALLALGLPMTILLIVALNTQQPVSDINIPSPVSTDTHAPIAEEWETQMIKHADGFDVILSLPPHWKFEKENNNVIYKPENQSGYDIHVKVISLDTKTSSFLDNEEVIKSIAKMKYFIRWIQKPEFMNLDGFKARRIQVELKAGMFPEMTKGQWKMIDQELVINHTRLYINASCKVGACNDEIWEQLNQISNKVRFKIADSP